MKCQFLISKFTAIVVLVLALVNCQKTKQSVSDFNGKWLGASEDLPFGVTLIQTGNQLKGWHCEGLPDGSRADCMPEEHEASITGTVENEVATVTITSGYSGESGKARMTCKGDTLYWELLGSLGTEFYIPYEEILYRKAASGKSESTAAPSETTKTFIGKIGKYDATFSLTRDGDQLSGYYNYDNQPALWGVLDNSLSEEVYDSEEGHDLGEGLKFVSKELKDDNAELKYTFVASYPQITGAVDAGIDKFNRAVEDYIKKCHESFKQNVSENANQEAPGSSDEYTYEIALANRNAISIKFSEDVYIAGTRSVGADGVGGKIELVASCSYSYLFL